MRRSVDIEELYRECGLDKPKIIDNLGGVYYPGGEVAHNVAYLAVCKYDNDEAYYIFHCDESLEVVADGCWDNIELCKKYMPGYNVKWLKQKD